jgi:predicted RNA-binding Zn-ribbon protein involved in translation (DUF1610 family)
MNSTLLHHKPQCRRSAPAEQIVPQPKDEQYALFKCPECGAVATTRRDAPSRPHA